MGSQSEIQIRILPQEQVLAGFLLESMEGIAIHSQGVDKQHLRLIFNQSTASELQLFFEAWNAFWIDSDSRQIRLEPSLENEKYQTLV